MLTTYRFHASSTITPDPGILVSQSPVLLKRKIASLWKTCPDESFPRLSKRARHVESQSLGYFSGENMQNGVICAGGVDDLLVDNSNQLCVCANHEMTIHKCLHTTSQTGARYGIMDSESNEEIYKGVEEEFESFGPN